jgi:hypothetical protein
MQMMMPSVVAEALRNVSKAPSFKTLRLARSTTRRHIPIALNLQQHCCDNLKPS